MILNYIVSFSTFQIHFDTNPKTIIYTTFHKDCFISHTHTHKSIILLTSYQFDSYNITSDIEVNSFNIKQLMTVWIEDE